MPVKPDTGWKVEELHRISWHKDSKRVKVRVVVALERTLTAKEARERTGSDTDALVYDQLEPKKGHRIINLNETPKESS